MQNAFQITPRIGISKDKVSQSTPVKFAIVGHDGATEPIDHIHKSGSARRNYRACRLIRVDDRNPELQKSPGNGTLTAADPAG